MFLADFFIRNDGDNDKNLRRTVERFLDVMFAIGVQTPTKDESAMYAATSGAAECACLSRKWVAVIANEDGDILGMGNNDVPKFGGGFKPENGAGIKKHQPVTDLNSVRASRHGANVLKRVIREGFTKKK